MIIQPNSPLLAFRRAPDKRPKDAAVAAQSNCAVCDRAIGSAEASAKCCRCSSLFCAPPKCGVWLEQSDSWECIVCHQMNSNLLEKTYNWIFKGLNGKRHRKSDAGGTEREGDTVMVDEGNATLAVSVFDKIVTSSASTFLTAEAKSSPTDLQQKVRVREFVEELVSSMLGGRSLDDVCVSRIYENLDCKYARS